MKNAIKNHIKSWFIKGENYSLTELYLSINSRPDFNEWHKKLCKKIVEINCDVVEIIASELEVKK